MDSRVGADGDNYPDQFADISYGVQGSEEGLIGFLTTPTPGAANSETVANVGPWITDVVDRPGEIAVDAPLVVTNPTNALSSANSRNGRDQSSRRRSTST